MDLGTAQTLSRIVKLSTAATILKNGSSSAVLDTRIIDAINVLLQNDSEFRSTFNTIIAKLGNKYLNIYNDIISGY